MSKRQFVVLKVKKACAIEGLECLPGSLVETDDLVLFRDLVRRRLAVPAGTAGPGGIRTADMLTTWREPAK